MVSDRDPAWDPPPPRPPLRTSPWFWVALAGPALALLAFWLPGAIRDVRTPQMGWEGFGALLSYVAFAGGTLVWMALGAFLAAVAGGRRAAGAWAAGAGLALGVSLLLLLGVCAFTV